MKCRKCNQKAVIHMRQHKLALCKDHFIEWVLAQTQRIIEKYKMFDYDDKILVAVSGGKDSLSLWHILSQLGYKADGLYIDLGIDELIQYSKTSKQLAKNFAEKNHLQLIIVDVKQTYGFTIPELAQVSLRGKKKPCSVCGMTKRHIMNKIARENKYDVLATGHNLDDEAATLFGNTLRWTTTYLIHQHPVLEANELGLVKKVKPLFRFYEREIAAYAFLNNIEYIYDECPFAKGAKSIYYKQLLNQIEERQPGAKLQFFLSYLRAKSEGLFPPEIDKDIKQLHPCPTCGNPTSSPGQCSFCRLLSLAQAPDN